MCVNKQENEGRESDRVMIARYLCAQHSLATHEARQTRKEEENAPALDPHPLVFVFPPYHEFLVLSVRHIVMV